MALWLCVLNPNTSLSNEHPLVLNTPLMASDSLQALGCKSATARRGPDLLSPQGGEGRYSSAIDIMGF